MTGWDDGDEISQRYAIPKLSMASSCTRHSEVDMELCRDDPRYLFLINHKRLGLVWFDWWDFPYKKFMWLIKSEGRKKREKSQDYYDMTYTLGLKEELR